MCLSLDGGDLNYDSSTDIAGFQFSHNGCVTGASGGDAAANGFTVSASGSTVLAFSFTGSVVPAGMGTLVELSGDVTQSCLSDFIFSNASGGALVVAFAGDDSCDSGVYDCAGVCDGDAVEDCAGAYALEIGALTPIFLAMEDRERVLDLIEIGRASCRERV